MRVLALDYGNKRIGVAISDPEQIVAFPRTVFRNDKNIFDELKQIIEQEGVTQIIIGWPLSLGGKATTQTTQTATFITELEAKLNLPVIKMDERWTTTQADRYQGDDAMAAQIILQTYLDMVK